MVGGHRIVLIVELKIGIIYKELRVFLVGGSWYVWFAVGIWKEKKFGGIPSFHAMFQICSSYNHSFTWKLGTLTKI